VGAGDKRALTRTSRNHTRFPEPGLNGSLQQQGTGRQVSALHVQDERLVFQGDQGWCSGGGTACNSCSHQPRHSRHGNLAVAGQQPATSALGGVTASDVTASGVGGSVQDVGRLEQSDPARARAGCYLRTTVGTVTPGSHARTHTHRHMHALTHAGPSPLPPPTHTHTQCQPSTRLCQLSQPPRESGPTLRCSHILHFAATLRCVRARLHKSACSRQSSKAVCTCMGA
jgi:hypothetical protein